MYLHRMGHGNSQTIRRSEAACQHTRIPEWKNTCKRYPGRQPKPQSGRSTKEKRKEIIALKLLRKTCS